MAIRRKGGQRLMDMAKKTGAAKRERKRKVAEKLKEQARRNVSAGSKPRKTISRQGVTITKRPGGSALARVAPTKPSTKSPTKSVSTKSKPKKVAKKAKPKTDAQKFADWRKNPSKGMAPRNLRTPAQRAALKQRLKNQMSEARSMSDLAAGLTGDLADAEWATNAAITAATVPLGGGVGRGALTGAKALARGAKTAGSKALTGAKVTGQAAKKAAKKAAKATKRAARKAKIGLKKADRKLLKAQGLSRQGGKVRKIKEPNPFSAKAGKGTKTKPKTKSRKKNPFAGSERSTGKSTGKQLDEHVKTRRRSRAASQQDAHVKTYKGAKVKKGRRKAESERKKAIAGAKEQRGARARAKEQAKSRKVERGYKQFDKDRKARSRKRGKV